MGGGGGGGDIPGDFDDMRPGGMNMLNLFYYIFPRSCTLQSVVH